ncbi:MAG TPA: 50S ribosomal protein L21 [Planctomycetes bacterium]|nr:50S ribosomal protein L21 [Planctomycetota bacterium]
MYAVIDDRGRQAGVRVGDRIACDTNAEWNVGDTITFDRVLVLTNEGDVQVGTPHVEGASVKARVLGPVKGKKEVVFRFKRRKNVRVKRGHRQAYTQVEITEITV